MAQQKMHCAVQRAYSDNEKGNNGGKFYSIKKSLEKDNFTAPLEDSEISSLNSRNSDKRFAVLTVFTPEPVGLWRIVTVPPECLDHTNKLGSMHQVNMDGLRLVSPSSINSFKVDRMKSQKVPVNDVTCSVKSFKARNFPGSDVWQQSRNRTLAHKVNNLNEFSSNSSSQSSITCSDSSPVIQQRSRSFKSSDIFIENSKTDNTVRRNSRYRARKKGKQNKKLSHESTDPEVLFEDYAHGILTTKTCGNNDVDHADMLVSYAASEEDSSSDSRVNINHVEDNSNRIVNCSELSRAHTSYIDKLELSEAKVPSRVTNFPDPLTDSRLMIQMEDRGSIIDGGEMETHHLQISHYDGIHSSGFSDMHDCLVLDSVSVDSNSDNSTTTNCDAKPHDRKGHNFRFSESLGFSSRKGCFSPQKLLGSVVDFHDYTEGMRYNDQRFNGSNMQVTAPDKRSKKAKMVPRSSSARNFHVRTGKESNNCVWQKVQKNDADGCNSEFKKASLRFHATQKATSSLRRNANVADIDMPSKSEDKKQLKDKVSKKLKRKTSPGSKQEYNCYTRRGSNPRKTSPNTRTEIGIRQTENVDLCKPVDDQKYLSSFQRSGSQIVSGIQSGKFEPLNSELFNSSQDCPENSESTESVSDTVSSMKEQQDSSLAKSCSPELDVLEVPSPVYLPHLMFNQVSETEKDIALAECGKRNLNSGSLLQKWIPIGTKDPQSTNSARCGSLLVGHSDKQGSEVWTLRSSVDEKAASPSQNLVSSLNVGIMSIGPGHERNSLCEDEKSTVLSRNTTAYAFKENNKKDVATDCFIGESTNQNFSAFETELNKIALAVNDTCTMQVASEAVQMATGGPIAEIERFLYFSSPVICRSPNLISCKCGSPDRADGASLCRHETPNIPLGCVWQWYEKHGSYGLEIRAEDYEQTNRLGVDRFSFRAYFVPFLSAVQLFRNCKSHSANSSHRIPAFEVSKAYKTDEKLQRSINLQHLPIFSVLVSQPCAADASALLAVKEVCKSELSSVSDKEELSLPSVDMTKSNDVELLFEYFESDQPWQRQPLYEKIHELVNGDGPSDCKMYGDPTNLNATNLHDLHPSSWYSVAWYPIYRIPDGNFRAAFLTYHSLGHMVQRTAKVDSANADRCIVSPVVGLQSYSAQSECWFQLRQTAMPNQTSENTSLNPSGILKERLRTLEETALRMSRAVVNRENRTSVNRHSDFEFFLSRRRS